MKHLRKTCLGSLVGAFSMIGIHAAAAEEAPAWLGVATAPLEEIVAAQLDLPEGVGAAVKLVVPDSPADGAGIKKNDVLFEFEGEPIKSPAHLSELVGAKTVGEEVSMAIIHRGDKKDITVTLGERPADLPQAADVDPGDVNLGDLKFEILPFKGGGDVEELEKQVEKFRQRMEEQFEGMLKLEDLGNLPGAADIVGMSSKSMMFSDGEGSIKIESKDGKTEVTAKDADGNLLFKGPANTEDERAKIPERVREKLDQFESSNIDLNFKGFDLRNPKLRVPDLKPDEESAPAEEDEVPPAKKDGKKIKV